jgi:hypothetical protein
MQNARIAAATASTVPASSLVRSAFGTIAGLVLHVRSIIQSSLMQNSQAAPTPAPSQNDTGTALNDAATERVIAAYLEHANDDFTNAGDPSAIESAASALPGVGTADPFADPHVPVTAQDQIADLQHEVAGAGSLLPAPIIIPKDS